MPTDTVKSPTKPHSIFDDIMSSISMVATAGQELLWEGRYKGTLLDSHTYLLACYRYVEPNPVPADCIPA